MLASLSYPTRPPATQAPRELLHRNYTSHFGLVSPIGLATVSTDSRLKAKKLPDKGTSPDHAQSGRRAAFASLFGAIISVILLILLFRPTASSSAKSLLQAALLAVLLCSAASAVYGLLRCRHHRDRLFQTFSRSALILIGMQLLALLLDFGMAQSHKGTARKGLMEQTSRASREYQEDVQKDFNRDGALSYDPVRNAKLQAQAKQAAQTSSSTESKLAQAWNAYFERMQSVTRAYAQAQQAWEQARVLDASLYASRQVISEKRQIAVRLQEENQNMTRFLRNSAVYYKEELKKLDLPAEEESEARDGFLAKTVPRHKIMLEIREQDEEIFQAALGILDTLSAHFGEWTVDDKGEVQIADTATSKRLKEFKDRMNTAAQKEADAQARLLQMGQ